MENKGELIVAIINKGYSDLVMDAAKKAGAKGGTIFNAHGTGNKEIEQYFGVPIHPEKEMVFIIVDKKIKDELIQKCFASLIFVELLVSLTFVELLAMFKYLVFLNN